MPSDSTLQTVTIAQGPARAQLMTYGASLMTYHFGDIDHSLVLGSPDPRAYPGTLSHFGAIVGPVANRVAQGRAPLGERVLCLPANEGPNTLHGGANGLSHRNWTLAETRPDAVTFTVTNADGQDGLPGPLTLCVTYQIDGNGALGITITGNTAALTLCNPAFHGYWSLTGQGLTGHRLTLNADHYTPTDAALIPTGEIAPVAGTGYDLRVPTPLPAAVGLDTNFCLNGSGLREVARLETDALALSIETDAQGLQVYDGAGLNTGGFGAYAGMALEPQLWPDAPNHPNFPAITLHPDQTFRQTSWYRFHR